MWEKVKKMFKFLFIDEPDKGNHLWVGLMMGLGIPPLLFGFFMRIADWPRYIPLILVPIITMWIVWLVAWLKERYDESKGKLGSYQDIKWTMIGGITGILVIIWLL